jgi:hypothetical protein
MLGRLFSESVKALREEEEVEGNRQRGGGGGGVAAGSVSGDVLESGLPLLEQLASEDPWWDVRAQCVKACAPLLVLTSSSSSLLVSVAEGAKRVVGAVLLSGGGSGGDGGSSVESMHPGLKKAVASSLACYIGDQSVDTNNNGGDDQDFPSLGPTVLACLYSMSTRDRNSALAPVDNNNTSNASSSSNKLGNSFVLAPPTSCLSLAMALCEDLKAKQLANMEVQTPP